MVRAFKLQSLTKSRIFSHSTTLFPPKSEELSVGNVGQLRGKAYAASARSDPTLERSRKRMPKERRKAMVESYVDEYRATNDGNFPTASVAVKQVGGSYYVIREILQELKYNSRTSAASEYSVRKEKVKDDELLAAEVQEHRRISVKDAKTEMDSQSKAFKDVRANDTDSGSFEAVTRSETVPPSITVADVLAEPSIPMDKKNLEAKDDYSVTHATQIDFQKEATHQENKSEQKLKPEVLQESHKIKGEQIEENLDYVHGKHEDGKEIKAQGNHLDAGAAQDHLRNVKLNKEDNGKKPIASDALHETHISKSKTEHSPRSHERENIKIDTTERQSTDTGLQEKSTFWGNLRSFADGIVKIWKKL